MIFSMNACIVLCPQNSYLSNKGSAYLGAGVADVLVTRLADFLSSFSGIRIFVRDKRSIEDGFFRCDKTHLIVNTPDCEIFQDLVSFSDVFCDKTRHSALFRTGIEKEIRNIERVFLVGLETHTSILYTAQDLRALNYEVTVIEPCVMSRNEYLHGCAISLMADSLGVLF